MARKKDKEKAIILRKRGLSYSDIKREMGINKSTLSGWLRDMPLSEERIKELRANNPVRIERYRNTMKNKRDFRLNNVFKKVSLDIGKLTEREVFIAGLFLYWAEGGKTKSYTTVLTNTNPN
jgi:transposase-like protein